ncbi:histidine kinase [Psychromonas marina]|uniref:histidine kinase n=1 Tax=Psychromonas marina TaxID=88364 RepID=A0ABQ6DW60_9GAMM|nr:response regulator [Psychromonas marina]GLS89373.1 histidine kinase [Psychromonas marina]
MYKTQHTKKLKNTVMLAFLALSIIPLTLISLFFLYTQSQDLTEQSKLQLTALRDNQALQIQNYFQSQESKVRSFARSELGIASGGRFYGLVAAFDHLGSDEKEAQSHAKKRYVVGSGDVKNSVIDNTSPNYMGSERYRLIHKRYHHRYIDLLANSDFDDILLVSLEGTVVYSVKKNIDYGSNLNNKKLIGSALANTFISVSEQVKESNEKNIPVVFSDFNEQQGEQIAWFAAPIAERGFLHSFVFFKLNNDKLTTLLNKDNRGKMDTILTDMQSISRIRLADNEALKIKEASIKQAIHGFTSVDSFENSKGENVLAAFTPITIQNKTWALAIELPEKIAYARIRQLEKIFIFTLLVALMMVAIASHYLSNSITAPILNLAWIAERIAAGDLNQRVNGTERSDEIGRLAISFARMKRSIREKLQLINEQKAELETNLTLIQQQNNDLQLTDKLKDEFLATTSHELRTPLHGMLGITETLKSGAYGNLTTEQQYQLEIINNSGHRLANLVDDLLDYHKIRYGNLHINNSAVDLSSAVHLVLELSKHLLENKPLRIINQIPEDLGLVIADEQRLEQVLYNLIGNAIKYTTEGKIIICSKQLDDKIQVQVIDTGQGIDAAQLEQIFEPLSQASVDSPYYRQGAGLGLSISRQLIELMGGRLHVSSQQHIGTTFSFTLPVASESESRDINLTHTQHFQAPAPYQQINVTTDSLPINPNAPLLIVADDEAVNLQVLVSFLRLAGYRVKTATNGEETLQLITEEQPALLLLDVMMPGMSGYEVCKAIRKKHDKFELPIIMLTALNQSKDRVRGFEAGANDYVNKPFNQKELTTRITAHMQATKAQALSNENIHLEKTVKEHQLVEACLQGTQAHLFTLLEHSPDAILCIRYDEKIHFANHNAGKLFKRSPQQLAHYNLEDILIKRSLKLQEQHINELDIYIEGKVTKVEATIIPLPTQSGLHSLIIFCTDNSYDAQRINNLEKAVDALSSYAFDGNSEQLQILKELGGEFTRLADKAKGSGNDKKRLKRELLVNIMTQVMDYWEQESGKTKFELAEQSQLWKVYLDRSTLQTRTLDKYLHIETLPKTPRWRTVLSTIDYVLANCDSENKQREKIEKLRLQLQKLLA